MKKKTLAWAVKYGEGIFHVNTSWTKEDAQMRLFGTFSAPNKKIVRVEIKEVKKK